jgi:hypothetical protein
MNNWFAAAAAGVLAIFGAHGDKGSTSVNFNQGSSTHKEQRVGTSTKPTLDVTCVANAVGARESSIDSAETTFTTAMNTAYTTRATALASAYAQSGNDAIRAAVKSAWKQFTTSARGSRSAWQKAKENAWQTFRTAIKSCGPSATSVADTENAGSEMNGQ